MAVPTDPTESTLCEKALLLAGYKTPTSAQKTECGDYWLQRVLNDIWLRAVRGGNTRLATLQTTAIHIATVGRRRVAMPTDFSEELTLNVLEGTHTDTLVGATSKAFTLAADEDLTDDEAVGAYILITAGTGIREYKEIITYVEGTVAGTTHIDWGTTPIAGDTYLIVDKHHPCTEQHQNDLDLTTNPTTVGRPDQFSKFGNELYFNKPFDGTYGLRMRYYANINKVDRDEGSTTLYTRILRNWQDPLTKGLLTYLALKKQEWDKYSHWKGEYENSVNNLLTKEMPFGGEFEGFEL
jgi:hypothetical protein